MRGEKRWEKIDQESLETNILYQEAKILKVMIKGREELLMVLIKL